MGRRQMLGLLLLALLLVFAVQGCRQAAEPGEEEEIGNVTVMGVWGEGEAVNFEAVASQWETETGGTMEFESTRDLSAILRARVAGGNPPDVAVLPNPALLAEFAAAGDLVALDDIVDMDQLESDYAETWIDQATVDDSLYGVFVRASTKSTVWYDPKTFASGGYEIPETWDALIALANEMKADGLTPWSLGTESGGASGWPGSDWIQEILLSQSGPDVYDQWVSHEIPWTDPKIKEAFETFGEAVLPSGNVVGGVPAILATPFQDSSYLPFEDPPRAGMFFLGAFVQGFLSGQFPNQAPVTDYDFFKFPVVNETYAGSATGGADVVVMFNDTPSARSLVEFLAQGQSWEPWARAGGYNTPSKALDSAAYPDPLSAKAAAQLTESAIFRFDADDLMPAELQNAYWSGILEYLQNPDDLDEILTNIEGTAAQAYAEQ